MPYDTAVVGGSSEAITHNVDARWLMAYAAGLGNDNPAFLDTEAGTVIGHPMFPVCLEWPAILDCVNIAGAESATAHERSRNVHANHDLHIFRPIRAGEHLTTTATIISLTQIRPGAAQTIRLDTIDERGELVCRTYQLGIKRGVDIIGDPESIEELPRLPNMARDANDTYRCEIAIAREAAHVYTECARIWNPVHTDRRVALAAGLPDIILHGTATMALAVSRIVDHILAGDAARVTRIGGSFSAMVLMPSTVTLIVDGHRDGVVSYTVMNAQDQPAISQGFLCYV